MYYNKSYNLSDKLNYPDMNDLTNNVRNLLVIVQDDLGIDTSSYPFWDYGDWSDWTAHPTLNPKFFLLNDFLYVEQIDAIEKSIMQLSFDFFQPPGYIQNVIWKKSGEHAVYKSFSYVDLNRMITDMNILYEYYNKWYLGEIRFPIYNLYSDENWEQESSLEWEE